MRRTLVALVAILLLAPGAGAPSAVGADRGAGPSWQGPARVEVLGVDERGATLGGKEFSADTVRYLRLIVWWKVSGGHRQRLELFAPDGGLYQRFATEFDGDEAAFRQRGGRSPWTLAEPKLLVGGTWITEHALYGTWPVDVYLDGASVPVASEEFVLKPRDTSRPRPCRSPAIC
jgi:hypothetical protein